MWTLGTRGPFVAWLAIALLSVTAGPAAAGHGGDDADVGGLADTVLCAPGALVGHLAGRAGDGESPTRPPAEPYCDHWEPHWPRP